MVLRHRFDHPFESRKDVSKGHGLRGKDIEDHEEDTHSASFKMAVALGVAKEQGTLLQVAVKHGVSPSLTPSWRDELPTPYGLATLGWTLS